jgi:hypothetical protein
LKFVVQEVLLLLEIAAIAMQRLSHLVLYQIENPYSGICVTSLLEFQHSLGTSLLVSP